MIVVVTGATGNVGRPLVEHLLKAGARVRAVTRRPGQAGLPPGVEQMPDTTEACKGASAVFLNSRALGSTLADVVSSAHRRGIGKLVALSAINADDADDRQPSRYRGDRNRECEQLAAGSGVPWVSLRPTVFATNFPGMWTAQIRSGDLVAGPYATASTAPIAEADIAAVAARAVLTDELDGQRVPLTGPQSLTNAELVEIVGAALHRPLRYQEVPAEFVRARFIDNGFSAEFADAYIALLAATATSPALVTHDVEKILGRPATPFAHWVHDHTALFTEEMS
ncbi:NAD(P)H-binding protein [Mycolicibacterium rhodesiae]|uniref:Nucleoside-diphosphate sugar epimerase n=1 Tax=Mycolicibacterium rhodesiae TaxID=36814 RepID=A0A1X0J3U7_MYCRH|nr:NAD(P)H-binding protein [Mycolicibacterium rhodesiae]MCV7344600.1 NAD(P)H-binding protein [Mycolicibacterium rhodesiae]ORB55915.1 nucleoside-diphosphate sugar epimerase [Mycolicibacterium rhodesiae]